MTALAIERMRKVETWKRKRFTLTGGKAFKGAIALLDKSTGKVVKGQSSAAGYVRIGVFAETVDATSADALVDVDLEREITLEWFANDTVAPLSATTDILNTAFVLDDQTVTAGSTATSVAAGRVWAVDSTRGVAVERFHAPGGSIAPLGTALSYTSNDAAPAAVVSGAIYDVPTTGAASTITLPAAAPDGTVCYFTADGTKNGHTITYRDATGPTALTTALTASKRHLTVCTKRGSKWFANAYVSP